jgi:hypothetical protein
MSSGVTVLEGSCGCGAVRYQVADAFQYAANCHCSRCRAATGSAFKAFAGIEREHFQVTDGLDRLLVFGIRPSEHIYVGSKAPWFEITDDLPQNQELDG